MTNEKKVYKNPTAGKPLISTISAGCKTPILQVKFSNLINAFYYPNSSIPRFSITCLFDPSKQKEFLKEIQTIEKNEGVETIIKNETEKTDEGHCWTGNVMIKFQSKDKIPIYIQKENKDTVPLELEDELKKGESVMIVYDILRYTKKNTMKTEHGISFKPSCIYYYENEKGEKDIWNT
jgi:hypothetical protein